MFEKADRPRSRRSRDVMRFVIEHSEFLNREENKWMKTVLEIVRKTSLYFQPQIRTKIMNEGWASYWHETLFMRDDRIRGHEVDFARVNAAVTAMPRVGPEPLRPGHAPVLLHRGGGRQGPLQPPSSCRLLNADQRRRFDARHRPAAASSSSRCART